jgi:alkylation response protein AidB-like acyl-CoA dehydrogenase
MFLPRAADGDEVEPWIYLRAIEEVSRHDGSLGWNLFVCNSATLIAPFLEPETMHTIFDDPRAIIAWGPPNMCQAIAVPGGYRISGEWGFASGCRQATWMGVHANVVEPDGSLRLNDMGRPTIRTLLFPAEHATHVTNWQTLGMRGTASEGYTLTDLFVPEAFSSTREDPTQRRLPGRLYAFPMQGLYAVGVAGVALGIARAMLEEFVDLATRKTPRGLQRLADSAVVQSNVARMEARLGAGRAYLVETLQDVWAIADDAGVIDIPSRARVRLACAHTIHEALAAADYAHKSAGVDAIFAGSSFERRFRDIHTLSQQIQSRDAHFEAVGRIMLGIMPEVFF